jgi:hypothetical protein
MVAVKSAKYRIISGQGVALMDEDSGGGTDKLF